MVLFPTNLEVTHPSITTVFKRLLQLNDVNVTPVIWGTGVVSVVVAQTSVPVVPALQIQDLGPLRPTPASLAVGPLRPRGLAR